MNYNVMEKLSFNSVRKRTSVVVEYEGESYMFVKGAGQILLDCCTYYHSKNQKVYQPLTKADIKNLENQIKEFTLRGLRVIVLAYKKLSK